MKKLFRILLPLCAVLLLVVSANAQDRSKQNHRRSASNPAVVVVKSVAKGAWVTTKFVAKHVAKPVAKAVFVKALPKVTVFMIKKSPVIVKRVLPFALKLALL